MNFLIVVGTAREGRASIGPAKAVMNEFQNQEHSVELFDLKKRKVPPLGNRTYVEGEEPVAEDIQEFSRLVEKSDGVVLAVPEYNHSIPGILKTLLDHLHPEYENKPFMYVTVSGGSFGGVRALSHLHDITLELGAYPGPDIPISNAGEAFNSDGEILDENYKHRLNNFVKKTAQFTENR
ncbi:NADPH-dependent FMN reductase [Candidatus Nanohalobium constans]|uniref:NADPH-dependent FMN reductase n=1 Tax=Candidatus Nanohalobium constans TaxID=2565781 RepID=A0A5Q0UF29_9ARCH|nr:NAD(P)H-dependent oxidoreductase [Candidatus Nanohalobium constans]QGA80167.1 NADPH-dependent FMN reductase [Candidatus Nanohalobium constans]